MMGLAVVIGAIVLAAGGISFYCYKRRCDDSGLNAHYVNHIRKNYREDD